MIGLERWAPPFPRVGEILRAADRHMVANAAVAWLFAITGPLVILLAVSAKAGLSPEETASWIFGGYAVGGVCTLLMSYFYRQPIGMAWTIPGAVLVGPALGHLAFSEVIGAYLATAALLTLLGLTGWVGKVMRFIPMPIVMGMVSGVFLPLALRIATGFAEDPLVASALIAAFFAASAVPAIGRVLPPVLAALLVGLAAVLLSGHLTPGGPLQFTLAAPHLFTPRFSFEAMIELVIPLAVAVIAVQNAQGCAILTAAGYAPPVNMLTLVSGIGSLLCGLVGSVSVCVTGPSNAIMCSSGSRQQRFAAGIVYGLLMIAFGLFAPLAAQLGLILPAAFIGVLGGLALLRVVQGSLTAAFGGELALGAAVTFLVTMSGVTFFHIGAAFWGLVAGVGSSWLLERAALRKVWRGHQS